MSDDLLERVLEDVVYNYISGGDIDSRQYIGNFLIYPGYEKVIGYHIQAKYVSKEISEISFDEFKKYVLNQEVVEIQEDYSYLNELFKKLNIK